MANFSLLLGMLSLLLILHWKHGEAYPLHNTTDNATCTLRHPCSSTLMFQIRSQLRYLSRSANDLFTVYNRAQGEPVTTQGEKLFDHVFMNSPAFHYSGPEKDKMVDLYHVIAYFRCALNDVMDCQKTLNSNAEDLHRQLRTTANMMWGLLSNVLCGLCEKYNMRPEDTMNGLSVLGKDCLLQKQLGSQLLMNYMPVIRQVAQAFQVQEM